MVDVVRSEKVDVVLMSGDIFDSRNPPGAAESMVAEILRAIADTGARTVMIAGNHDSPQRLDSWRILAELANVTVVPRPVSPNKGGVIRVPSRDGLEHAIIAAIPFAPPSRFLDALAVAGDDTLAFQTYAESFKAMVNALCGHFAGDAVNILMAHTHFDGATLANSERKVHVGTEWAALPQCLPAQASYVALGHIHRPQRLMSAAAHTRYAGSPLQMDFGEVGEEKTFPLIRAKAGKPPEVELIPYAGAQTLHDLRLTMDEIAADSATLKNKGWLRITVPMDSPDPDIARKVRDALPNALIVRAELPAVEMGRAEAPSLETTPMTELFKNFYEKQRGSSPNALVMDAFAELYKKAEEAQ
jgi:exonuclease SbcD